MKKETEAIVVRGVSKTFILPHEKQNSIKSKVVSFYKRKKGYEIQEALSDISFEVHRGEFFGIVGKNGGGKSTLLKILAGIYEPDTGSVYVDGPLTPFIELGVGFNQELTGRENIYLNGSLFGFNRKQMSRMYKDIVDFAELYTFMDQKLKNYSSGMQVRLAFSIAIHIHSDILVMDEVLAVGDAAFQKKCLDVFRRLKKEGKTIVLVTHDMSNVERFCDRALVLDKGKMIKVTTPHEASNIYARLNVDYSPKEEQNGVGKAIDSVDTRWGAGGITVKKATTVRDGKPTTIFNIGDTFSLKIELERTAKHKHTAIVCGLAFINDDGHVIIGPNSLENNLKDGCTEIEFKIENLSLAPGEYRLTIAIYDDEAVNAFDFLDGWLKFSVISDHRVAGLVDCRGDWNSK